MKHNILWVIILVTILFGNLSCDKDKPIPKTISEIDKIPDNYVLIGETYIWDAGAKAKIYAENALILGYNKLHIALYDSIDNSRLNDGYLILEATTQSFNEQIGGPLEPDSATKPSNKFWNINVIFNSVSEWNLQLYFHNNKNNKDGQGSVAINIDLPELANIRNIKVPKDSNNELLITLIQPLKPKLGINYFEITIHKKISPTKYVPIKNYNVEIEPIMQSMNHGSSNNINPVHTSIGHYIGKANFNMPGIWNVKLVLKNNGVLLDSTQYFEIPL